MSEVIGKFVGCKKGRKWFLSVSSIRSVRRPSPTRIYTLLLTGCMLLTCGIGYGRTSVRPEIRETVEALLRGDTLAVQEKIDTLSRDTTAKRPEADSTLVRKQVSDALGTKKDSLSGDSILSELKSTMHFRSNDSVVIMPNRNLVRMYGDAGVEYEKQTLGGDYMHFQTDSGLIYSTYIDYPDSLKKEKVYAKISQGEQDQYEAKSILYNIKTSRGYITDVLTQQGEGFVTAEKTKRMENSDLFLENGRYTTCDDHEHPHFYIALTKAKVRPQKDIVTGPAYLVISDVPLPVGLPFAFFPFSTQRSSGFIMPTYGDEMDRGFYLRNAGWYFAINDYVDLQVTGDIYTKGSWGANARSSYRKRYKYSGALDASYIVTKRGDKLAGDYSVAKDFRIAWNHSQDPKANPFTTFSANVNFSTSSYNHNDLNALYNQAVMGQNTKSSSISFSHRFPNSPWSISGSMDIAQRSQDSTVNVTLPNLSITMSRIYPFKRKVQVGKDRWYEKISLSYSGQFRNSFQGKESRLFSKQFLRDWRNGMSHSIPVSASFDLFDYLKITPSLNYQERWYTSKVDRAYDPALGRVAPVDTTFGFYRVYDFNASVALSTTLYGFYKPLPFLGDKVNMIRHRMEPSISLNYRPDFGQPRWGYWQELNYVDNSGREVRGYYSPFENQMFGVPGQGKSGSMSISVNNNVEAKVKAKGDSVEFRKISLIESLSLGTSYNFAADSFRWSDISAALSLRLTDQFTLRLSGSFDPYYYDYHEYDGRISPYRVNRLRILNGRGLGRFRGTSTSFSYTLSPKAIKDLVGRFTGKDRDKEKKDKENEGPPDNFRDRFGTDTNGPIPPAGMPLPRGEEGSGGSLFAGSGKDDMELDRYGYVKSTLDWSLSFNYNLSLGWGEFNPAIKEYDYRWHQDLSFNGNFSMTKNWRFNFSANYNFDLKKITNMSCNVTRNLHCWSMTASFIPLGPYKSYNFTISVNSQLLKDLKYLENSHPRRRNDWY